MDSIASMAADIDARKLRQARLASMEEKLLDGPRLFRLSCEAIKAGLRLDHPEADEDQIHHLLIERVYGTSKSSYGPSRNSTIHCTDHFVLNRIQAPHG